MKTKAAEELLIIILKVIDCLLKNILLINYVFLFDGWETLLNSWFKMCFEVDLKDDTIE